MSDKRHLERAAALVTLLQKDGYEPGTKHYPPGRIDELDRWYVLLRPDPEGPIYSVQYNPRLPDGTVQQSQDAATVNDADDKTVRRIDALREMANRRVP